MAGAPVSRHWPAVDLGNAMTSRMDVAPAEWVPHAHEHAVGSGQAGSTARGPRCHACLEWAPGGSDKKKAQYFLRGKTEMQRIEEEMSEKGGGDAVDMHSSGAETCDRMSTIKAEHWKDLGFWVENPGKI